MASYISGNLLSEIKQLATQSGALVQVNLFFCCPDGEVRPQVPGGGRPQPGGAVAATALRFRINILMENLDTLTWLQAIVRSGAETLADPKIMHGVKPEFFSEFVDVQFGRNADLAAENLTLELVHPGIPSNEQPHVRLQVTDVTFKMTDGSTRAAKINMEEAANFTDKHHEDYPPGHLNFVDGARSSGQLTIYEL